MRGFTAVSSTLGKKECCEAIETQIGLSLGLMIILHLILPGRSRRIAVLDVNNIVRIGGKREQIPNGDGAVQILEKKVKFK
jgi:hypothetical protein